VAVAVLIALVITVPHMVADDGRLLIGYKKHDVPEELKTRRVAAPLTVLAVASLGVFMAFVDATIVNIAFPDIAESFPSSDFASLSWGCCRHLVRLWSCRLPWPSSCTPTRLSAVRTRWPCSPRLQHSRPGPDRRSEVSS